MIWSLHHSQENWEYYFKLNILRYLGLHLVFNANLLRPYFPPLLEHIQSQLTDPKIYIHMFNIPLLLTPLFDRNHTIQERKQISCLCWTNQDNSQIKESGILSLNWSTSFLICLSKQWGPLPLKGGGLIHSKIRLKPSIGAQSQLTP